MSIERQPAKRVFAAEFNDSTHRYQDTDEVGSPSFILFPTGDRASRVWISGTLLQVSDIGSGEEYLQARVADFSGTVYLYARPNYQEKGVRQLKALDPPTTVSVVGKVHTYDPDDDTTYVSIEPETVTPISNTRKEYWKLDTAIRTRSRIQNFDPETDPLAALAAEHYPELSPTDYQNLVKQALDSEGVTLSHSELSPSHQTPA